MKGKHDPYCKAYYPALTDPETCTWCYVIREVRTDEYLQAWNEGFGIGYGEGYEKAIEDMSINKDDAAYVYEQGRSLRDEARAKRMQRSIDKWDEDIDIAYWQGYNNAMIEKDNDE